MTLSAVALVCTLKPSPAASSSELPTWMGHASSVAHRVLDRLDAELGAEGRPPLFDKAARGAISNTKGRTIMSDPETGEPDPDISVTDPAQPKQNPSGSAAGDGEADTASGGAPEPPD